jgi:hypothetical protein
MKNLFIFLIYSTYFSVFSQFKSKNELKSIQAPRKEFSINKQQPKKFEKRPVHDEYVVHKEKLKTYFVSNQIPVDFPKYDKALSYDINKANAIEWAKKNAILFKENFRNELK